jgi:hypothetical protein
MQRIVFGAWDETPENADVCAPSLPERCLLRGISALLPARLGARDAKAADHPSLSPVSSSARP